MAINYTFPLSGTWSSPRWLTRALFPPGTSSLNGRRVTLEATYSHRAKLLTTECSSVGKFTTRGAAGCWRTPTEELWQPSRPRVTCARRTPTVLWCRQNANLKPASVAKVLWNCCAAKERTLQPKPRIPGVMWFRTHRLQLHFAIVLRFWKADWKEGFLRWNSGKNSISVSKWIYMMTVIYI